MARVEGTRATASADLETTLSGLGIWRLRIWGLVIWVLRSLGIPGFKGPRYLCLPFLSYRKNEEKGHGNGMYRDYTWTFFGEPSSRSYKRGRSPFSPPVGLRR